MKKSLIALAVLGSVAGAAQAQSAVTLYGIVDLWVGSASTTVGGVKTSTTQMTSGGISTSRWGMQGSEDLGGGLKAVFKLEQGFNADNGTARGTNTAFGRQAYLGVQGGFGTVTLGNTWTAMDDILGASNSGFDSALSASNTVLVVPEVYAGNPGNTIKYVSPSFGGISAGFSHSLKEANADGGVTDFSLSYGAGPIAANFAYQTQRQAGDDLKLTALNGSYDLGVAKLLASYGQAKEGALKATDLQFGADVPLSSALTLSAGYAQSKDNAALGNGKRTGFGVAASYSLSKRTSVYAGARSSKAKDGATLVDGTSEKASVYAVGLKHTF
ncbi:MAG: porin [Hydrogenophaga sp.]|jgi:predicted porin|nr:porin [Hydrogenophaga sp.]